MEEALVSFEVAKLAKEKGFDEVVLDTFSPSGLETDRYDISLPGEGYHNEELKKAFETTNSKLEQIQKDAGRRGNPPWIARPTQSLLQKWLREVHKIDIEFATTFSRKYGFQLYKDLNPQPRFISGDYDTYEEALEQAIKEALKII